MLKTVNLHHSEENLPVSGPSVIFQKFILLCFNANIANPNVCNVGVKHSGLGKIIKV